MSRASRAFHRSELPAGAEPDAVLVLATSAMATRFELVLVDDGDRLRARAAGEAALEAIARCDAEWSAFASDSFLAHLNRTAAVRPVPLDADQFELLAACDDAWRASGGAFDPSVAPLLRALDARAALDVDAARERVGWSGVRLDRERRTLRFARPGVALDLGGIAKGHALELAARELRAAGIANALLHGGTSSVLALGSPPDAAGWRVALEGGAGAPTVELRDASLSVSAQHGRTLADGSGHVLDPRARAGFASDATVAVVAADARIAEAWSTALLVLGELPSAPEPARAAGEACGAFELDRSRREPRAESRAESRAGRSAIADHSNDAFVRLPRGLDAAIGRGPRFARIWQYNRSPDVSSFARSAQVPT